MLGGTADSAEDAGTYDARRWTARCLVVTLMSTFICMGMLSGFCRLHVFWERYFVLKSCGSVILALK